MLDLFRKPEASQSAHTMNFKIARQMLGKLNQLLSVGLVLGVVSCNAALDTADLNSKLCPETEKVCSLDGYPECAPKSLPSYGCAAASCAPCALPNADARCATDGSCAISSCQDGFENCDGDESNGCEVEIRYDPMNCGSCKDSACPSDNGIAGCSEGQCTILCDIGFENCDGDIATGCEYELADSSAGCFDSAK